MRGNLEARPAAVNATVCSATALTVAGVQTAV